MADDVPVPASRRYTSRRRLMVNNEATGSSNANGPPLIAQAPPAVRADQPAGLPLAPVRSGEPDYPVHRATVGSSSAAPVASQQHVTQGRTPTFIGESQRSGSSSFIDTAAPPGRLAEPPPRPAPFARTGTSAITNSSATPPSPYSPAAGLSAPAPQAAPPPPGGVAPAVEDEVDARIAQLAAMEKFGAQGLVVEFTDDQARALEEAALMKAIEDSEREEAAMWGLSINDGPNRVSIAPPAEPPAPWPDARTHAPPAAVPQRPVTPVGAAGPRHGYGDDDHGGAPSPFLLARPGSAGAGASHPPAPAAPPRQPSISSSSMSHRQELELDSESVEGSSSRPSSKRFSIKRMASKLRGGGKRSGSGGADPSNAAPLTEANLRSADAAYAATPTGAAAVLGAFDSGGDTPAEPLSLQSLSLGAPPASAHAPYQLISTRGMGEEPAAAARSGYGAELPAPIAEPPAYLRAASGATPRGESSVPRASGGEPVSPVVAAMAANRAGPGTFAAGGGGAGGDEEDDLARVLRESEMEAARRRQEEEAEFEAAVARALAESQAAAGGAGFVAGAALGAGAAATGARDAAVPSAGSGTGEEEDEEAVLARIMAESQAEEEARRAAAAEEEAALLRALEESSGGQPVTRRQASIAPEVLEQAVAASTAQADVDECLREASSLKADFASSAAKLEGELAQARTRRGELERSLAAARGDGGAALGAGSVALSAQYATVSRDVREMEKRAGALHGAVEELASLEEFVINDRPPREEYFVVKDAIMAQVTEELSMVGWSVRGNTAVQAASPPAPVRGAPLPATVAEPLQASPAQAAAAAATVGAVADRGVGGGTADGAAVAAVDLNATLTGLRDMRQRMEERRMRRERLAGGSSAGSSSSGAARDSSAKDSRRSAYQAALENLKQNIRAKQVPGGDGSQAGSRATSATGGSRPTTPGGVSERGPEGQGAALAPAAAARRTAMMLDSGSSTDDDDEEGPSMMSMPSIKRERSSLPKNFFNPEDFLQQKREWTKSLDNKEIGLPSQCFEHLVVVGLPPTVDQNYLASAANLTKARGEGAAASGGESHRGPKGPALPAEVLFSYPPHKPLANGDSVADFCFPHGVQPALLERTPSMSSLNEVIYGQQYHDREDHSFVFVLKVGDNLPQYGMCCYVEEFVGVPPPIAAEKYAFVRPALGRHVLAAPRCYCLLSHYPFFVMHFQVLDMMLGLGRLERIRTLVEELSAAEPGGEVGADLLSSRLAALTNDSGDGASTAGANGAGNPDDDDDEASFASGTWSSERRGPAANGGGVGEAGASLAERVASGAQATPSRQGSSWNLRVASALQVLQHYYEYGVPAPGEVVDLRPEPTLKAINYTRPLLHGVLAPPGAARSVMAMADAEAADALRHWTIAALCRTLSLDNVLTLLTAALLERQVTLFCPNIGLLSAVVLALVPLLRPFAWQGLMLPILPASMLGFVEAPVPFVLGILYKTPEARARCAGLMRVNVYKNRIKNARDLPALPGAAKLAAALSKPYAALAAGAKDPAALHSPVYQVTDAQRSAADAFLSAVQAHLAGVCANLRAHTITHVQTSDHVSMLLKDSFVESFGSRDKPFVKQLVETQLFAVYCDAVLA